MKRGNKKNAKRLGAWLLAALLFGGLFLAEKPAQAASGSSQGRQAALGAAPAVLGAAPAQTEPFRYGRTQLDGAALYAYDLLTEQLICENPAETLYPEPGIVDKPSMIKALQVFLADYPECFWLTGGYEGSLSGDYYFEVYLKARWQGGTLQMMRQAVEQQAERFLAEIDAAEDDRWELALAVHDRLTEYLSYEVTDKDQTVYGALVEKRCVCTGYARAYQYLLNRVGIPAFLVEGDADNGEVSEPERHAWTLLWPEAGVCVYTDVTWDDHGDEPWHRCFSVSAAQIGTDHFPDPDLIPLPECGHEGLDYYHQGRGLLLTPETTAAEAAVFCQQIGEDRYRLDFLCEGTTYESWTSSANIRALITALGYQNASVCSYQIRTRSSEAEYRMTLQITGGIKASPAESTAETTAMPAETMPPTAAEESVTLQESSFSPESTAPGESPEESAAATASPEANASAEAAAEEDSTALVLTIPDETAGTMQENGGREGSLLSALLGILKGAGIVLAAITGLILVLIVLTRIGKKK